MWCRALRPTQITRQNNKYLVLSDHDKNSFDKGLGSWINLWLKPVRINPIQQKTIRQSCQATIAIHSQLSSYRQKDTAETAISVSLLVHEGRGKKNKRLPQWQLLWKWKESCQVEPFREGELCQTIILVVHLFQLRNATSDGIKQRRKITVFQNEHQRPEHLTQVQRWRREQQMLSSSLVLEVFLP